MSMDNFKNSCIGAFSVTRYPLLCKLNEIALTFDKVYREGCGQCFVGEFCGGGSRFVWCPWKGESCWVSIVHLLSECIYFRDVRSLRLSRLPIKTIQNALRNLLTTRLSVGCAEQWRRASAHVSVERTLPYQLKAVKLGFIFVTISHTVPRKHFVDVPDGRDARICLFHFPVLPFAVLVGAELSGVIRDNRARQNKSIRDRRECGDPTTAFRDFHARGWSHAWWHREKCGLLWQKGAGAWWHGIYIYRPYVEKKILLRGNLRTVLWRGWWRMQLTSSNRLYVWGLLTFFWLCCESTFQMQGHCDCVYFLPKDFAKTMIPW